ncbi:tripartite tricarboxylate transporter TctB family protein [Thermotoga caldifontis]|uniref:tripartite tricarboxylate transporter TctB family protein n=1 Tax=Thermotoga caldifontis TaxID=1508419 RepID=UPI000597218A
MTFYDFILGCVLAFISIFVLLYSRKFPHFVVRQTRLPGPSFFPRVLAIILLCFAVYFFVEYFLRRKEPKKEKHAIDTKSLLNILWFCTVVLFFFPFANFVGTFLALSVLSFLSLVILKSRWYEALIFSLAAALTVHLIFRVLFKIPLPEGILFTGLR